MRKSCINNVDLSKRLDSNIETRWNTKSQPQISHDVRKFAISVGFDYQLEWMVMHNGADLTKLRPGIPFVCSPCKRKRGPRDHPPGIEGRVHDTCRQKLVIRLYAARFGNPSHIGFRRKREGGEERSTLGDRKTFYPWRISTDMYRYRSHFSRRADISETCWKVSITVTKTAIVKKSLLINIINNSTTHKTIQSRHSNKYIKKRNVFATTIIVSNDILKQKV